MAIPRVLLALPAAALAILLSGCNPDFGDGDTESIRSFQIDAEVAEGGTMAVTESITYDFGRTPNAGLLWEYPLSVREGFLRHRALEVTDVEVSSPSGAPDAVMSESRSGGRLSLRIGDHDDRVRGPQTYDISYTVAGALTAAEGYDELYWDFISTGWGVPIEEAQVTLRAPGIGEAHCYAGDEDSESPCGQATVSDDASQAEFGNGRLIAGQGLTVLVELESGTVEVAEPDYTFPPLPRWLTWTGVLAVVGGVALVLGMLKVVSMLGARRIEAGRARWGDAVPPDLSPGAAGLLASGEKLRGSHLLALLMGLEERGVVGSEPHPEHSGEWVFHLRDPRARVTAAEAAMLEAMFATGPTNDLRGLTTAL